MARPRPLRKQDPLYLIVADETEEFGAALRYAALAAGTIGARIAVLHVMPEPDFAHWGGVEEHMNRAQRKEAEDFVARVAARIEDLGAPMPILLIESGDKAKAVLKVLDENTNIIRLILGGDTKSSGPGPLVTFFSGKGMAQLAVPLTVVPGHIAPEQIEHLV